MTPHQAALQAPTPSESPWNGDQLFSSASVECSRRPCSSSCQLVYVWPPISKTVCSPSRSAEALSALESNGIVASDILTEAALHNAMVTHAAFGGSTNLLLHIPAIAHAAGLPRPSVDDWTRINRSVPRLVDALPNGPAGHPTVRVFLAGGVPEVMLHLRDLGLLQLEALTVGRRYCEALS